MTRQGRKPLGPALVQHLPGSERAKQRLEVILETLAGKLTIREACDCLGIHEAMFHKLRAGVLQVGLTHLEPRPLGRPPRTVSPEPEEVAALQERLEDLESELHLGKVREEIAHVLPHVVAPGATGKKTKSIHSERTGHPRRSP